MRTVDETIGTALADGWISRDEEPTFRRLFAINADATTRLLEKRKPMIVHREYESAEAAYRDRASTVLGIPEDEVI